GLDLHRRRLPHGGRRGRRRRRGQPDPDDARADHARRQGSRRTGEHRGRRDGEVCREAARGGEVVSGSSTPRGNARGGPFATIEEAIKEIAAGRPVVVVDDEDRENEGDLIFAAQMATPELLAFMVRHTSGFICAPLTEAEADRLDLPPMYYTNQDRRGTAYTVTVDAREGITTGISAA